jgi:hypothetical protein
MFQELSADIVAPLLLHNTRVVLTAVHNICFCVLFIVSAAVIWNRSWNVMQTFYKWMVLLSFCSNPK